MNVLVINCGSSSIKYKLYTFPQRKVLAKGLIEKIGEKGSSIGDHTQGVRCLFERLREEGALTDVNELHAIGHRVVHGGESFRRPHIIDQAVLEKIKECVELAPLHNPANLAGITGCTKIIPSIPQVAVFDTAFHHTIPAHAYMYAVPYEYYQRYGIRKYGFHGTSHQFVAQEASKLLKRPLHQLKLITCHLGNGCSITAIEKGKSVDTSMGFTPLEGLMMGTRSGDIDVAAVFYLMEKENISPEAMEAILNRKSGLLGFSGISNDIRMVRAKARKKQKRAQLALEMFLYRIKKYIGAYQFILGGADAVVFTAGIGENNPDMINHLKKDIQNISPRAKVLVIPTDEELMIASLTYDVVTKKKNTSPSKRSSLSKKGMDRGV